jgi:hypothetical protein
LTFFEVGEAGRALEASLQRIGAATLVAGISWTGGSCADPTTIYHQTKAGTFHQSFFFVFNYWHDILVPTALSRDQRATWNKAKAQRGPVFPIWKAKGS